MIICSRVPESLSNCSTTASAVANVLGSSSTIALYSASTVVICWPAWMRPSSATAFAPSPVAPMPSVACSRAVNSRSVSNGVRPAAVSAARPNRSPAAGSSSRRSNPPSRVARTAVTSSSVRAAPGTYQARTAVSSRPAWSAQVIAIADHVSCPSPRSTRCRVPSSVRDSSSLPRA